ncbi:3',5'-cyclic AMP phosphodiesterase CpdA [Pseudarthrobacter sp. PvP004]|uniref:phosphodiesterase n=1 Tax=Pseudarthrobacter sp. PvP004 TaxID=2817850 RepID=UPI001AE8767A|nr:phosphodiesterase [Pseudarthrobacter sp. PvP004]MBP2266125.1 3',5'-cyclic AMP phosphodiesterase CpdA [Pseudarthrobacter sp. PvP004]
MTNEAQHPAPEHFILHISDTHFVADDDLLHGSVDSDENLRQLFRDFVKAQVKPEAMVFTGDLADTGRPDAYVRLRNIVEPVAEELGAKIIWVMGNHDERAAFRAGLLGSDAGQESVDMVHDVNGLRIIALDSTVPGLHHGEISDEQLEWLANVLATPAPHGTLIALHHPPVPSPLEIMAMVELREQSRFEKVIEGTDVRGILAGHLHYSTFSTFAGVPVSVASATCYTQDLNVPRDTMRGQNGAQAFNLVHLYQDRVLNSVVPIGEFSTVYSVSAEQMAAYQKMSLEDATAAMRADYVPDVEPAPADANFAGTAR